MLEMFGIGLPENESGIMMYILIAVVVFIWIYSILWTAKDISWRTDSFGMQLLSILLVLFFTPIFGLPLYFLLRPVWAEVQEQEQFEKIRCFSCNSANDGSFSFCVFCGEHLKAACPKCKKPNGVSYQYCAWCGHDLLNE